MMIIFEVYNKMKYNGLMEGKDGHIEFASCKDKE